MGVRGGNSCIFYAPDPRRLLAESIVRNRGNLMMVIWEFGVDRNTIYHYVADFGLWPMVNRARRERVQSDILNRKYNSDHRRSGVEDDEKSTDEVDDSTNTDSEQILFDE